QDTPVPAPTVTPPGRNPALQQDPPVTARTLLPPAVPMHTSRLEDVLAAMGTAPEREWRDIELATLLRLDRSDLTGELIRWSRRQILIKTGPATFKIPDGLPSPPSPPSPLKTSSRSWPPILAAPGTPAGSPLR
ncbi:hypothetical protein ACWD4N_45775, partial [Streptomyces sp. NPDC002586]